MKKVDGKQISREMLDIIKEEITFFRNKTGKIPGLTVIIVGEDPASKIYVNKKNKTGIKLGLNSQVIALPHRTSQKKLINIINDLNNDNEVDAILVQLPLPQQINSWQVIDSINPAKDVDGIHPLNLGMVLLNRTEIFPCTPAGILKILDYHQIDVTGMNAVVIGRSIIVGKPLASMLTNRNATVTICHSRTREIKEITRKADLVVAALGKTAFLRDDMVKKGAILIDVGTNYLTDREQVREFCDESQITKYEKKGYGITGDIHKKAFKKASLYTPAPGGVGPMTITMLMHNTLHMFKKRVKKKS